MLLPGTHAPLPYSLFILDCTSSRQLRRLHHEPLLSQSFSLFTWRWVSFPRRCLRPWLSDYPKRLLPSRHSKCYPSFKSWLESRYCTKPSLISPGPNHPFLLSSSSCYDLGWWLCHLLHDILLGLSAPLQMCSMDHLVFTGLCFPTIS